MLVPELRQRVYKANMDLPVHGLVKFTWGNVSAIDREKGLIVINLQGYLMKNYLQKIWWCQI